MPKGIFVDALASPVLPRVTGRYCICPHLYNGRECYYSRMARLYLFNAGNADSPEWAIGKKCGSRSVVLLLAGVARFVEAECGRAHIFVQRLWPNGRVISCHVM